MNTEKRNARGRGRGRGRGRARGRGRGRGKKVPKVMSSDEEECSVEETAQDQEEMPVEETKEEVEQGEPPKLEVPSDISQLEAPVFTTIQRGPPEPMLRLDWSHRATLIGEKVLNPMIYCCDICSKPILIYGRMIPCKHVFCLSCARADHTHCPRCREKVLRVEQTGLGTVYMCTHSGTRYGNTGCRRTYLSQRDLQAHINHRHVSSGVSEMKSEPEPPSASVAIVKPLSVSSGGGATSGVSGVGGADPRAHAPAHTERPRARTNLITVPIHDQPDSHNYYNYYQQGGGVPVGVSHSMSVPPPAYYPAPYAAPPATYVAPGATMTPNVAGGPMPAVPMGPVNLPEPNRWAEGSYQPNVQWPQNQHHYYR